MQHKQCSYIYDKIGGQQQYSNKVTVIVVVRTSWLCNARTSIGMCVGAGTAELAREVLIYTVNRSGLVDWRADIQTTALWDAWDVINLNLTYFCDGV